MTFTLFLPEHAATSTAENPGAAEGRGFFYGALFSWLSISGNRPSIVGTYTNDLVYEWLAPGILKELEARKPKDDQGSAEIPATFR